MDPLVTAAIAAGTFGLVTLVGTLLAQICGIRCTAKDTHGQLAIDHSMIGKRAAHLFGDLHETYRSAALRLADQTPS